MSLLSPVALSRRRSFVARLKLHTGVPCGVYRNSGSRPRLPTKVILLKDIMRLRLSYSVDGRFRGDSSGAIVAGGNESVKRVSGRQRGAKFPDVPMPKPPSSQ